MRSLDIIACGGFIAALIALPFSFYCFHRAPIRSALFFGVPILVSMAAADTSQRLTHDQILDKLDALKGDYHISISGRAAQNPGEIVAALKKLDWLAAHHSSPTKRTTVEISDG